MKTLRYIIITLLLTAALQAAGQLYVIDKVCLGAQRHYRIDGEANSTYLWQLTDTLGNKIPLSNPAGMKFTANDPATGQPKEGSEVTIDWTQPGTYQLSAIQYSQFGCDTLQQGKVQVFELPTAFAGNPDTICAGETVKLAKAVANNYSVLLWTTSGDGLFDHSGDLQPVYTPGPNDQQTGKVILTLTAQGQGSSSTCIPAESTVEIMINKILPVSVSIVADQDTVCAGTRVTFTATPVNGGKKPMYQWQVNGVDAGMNSSIFTYIPVNSDTVTVVMTSGERCVSGNPATSNKQVMSVKTPVMASVTIATDQTTVCAGTPVTFTATPVNGGSAPHYQWKVNGFNFGTNSETFTYVPGHWDIVSVVMISNETCVLGSPAKSNELTIKVIVPLPVSVSIIADQTAVCAGTTVTFNATPVNGGTPQYQWQVNGVNTGTNSDTYAYIPVNGDKVAVVMTSSETCVTGNPAMSNTVSIRVSTPVVASVTIVADQDTVCAGTTVTFTATPQNGGPEPQYQWKVNGVNTGTNSDTFAYIPLNGDKITVVMTSNEACVTDSPATSNELAIIVNTPLVASVIIAADQDTVCAGTIVTFTATPVNGGTTPQYQWKMNGIDAGTNSGTFAYVPINGDKVTVVMTSNEPCVTGNPATSNEVTTTVTTPSVVAVTIVADQLAVCAGTTVTFTATPEHGGTAPQYQWKVNGINAGTNSDSFAYIPVNGDVVTVVLTSNEICITGNPATSNSLLIRVSTPVVASVSIVADQMTVCAGTKVTFTASAINGGPVPQYQWQVNGNNAGPNNAIYTYAPANGDTVKVVMTSNEACVSGSPATSNELTIIANPPTVAAVTIAVDQSTICAGIPVTFTATPENGGTIPQYQWKVNGFNFGTNSETFTYVPANWDKVTVVMTSSETCVTGSPATSNELTIKVITPIVPSVTILADQLNVCAGTNVTFTATPDKNETAPVYQWLVNGIAVPGQTTETYIVSTLTDTDKVTVMMTSSEQCANPAMATSNEIMITTSSVIPAVQITSSSNTICSGESVTFSAHPTNGGTSPAYQWMVNGTQVAGQTTAIFITNTLADNDKISVTMTSSYLCANPANAVSNVITIISTNVVPAVTITSTTTTICSGGSVTFTAHPTNGGNLPSYQWRINGITVAGQIGAIFTTTTLADNDKVTVVLTSSEACALPATATSNEILVTATSAVPVVTITASATTICTGGSVMFTAVSENGGSTPAYQWMVNGIVVAGQTAATFTTTTLADNDIVTVLLTSSDPCATPSTALSNKITVTVTGTASPSVTIAANTPTICAGTSVTFTATPVNGGTSPVYQWKINGVNVGINSTTYTYVPKNNDKVTVALTSSEGCVPGSPVLATMTITLKAQTIPIFGTIATSICKNSPPPILPTTSLNGITGTWNPATIDVSIVRTTAHTFTPDANQCASIVTKDITIYDRIKPSFGTIGPYCIGSTADPLPATSKEGITGTWIPATIQTANLGSASYQFTPDAGQCALVDQISVTIVIPPAIPTGAATQTFCILDNKKVSDIAVTAADVITWYDTPSGGNIIDGTKTLVTGTYYASQHTGSCESDRLAVDVTVSDPAAPTGAAAQSFCALDNQKVSDIAVVAAGTVTWYDAPTAGNVIAKTTALVTGKTYYASQTIDWCEGKTRLPVTVTITDPKIPTGSAAQAFCALDNKKVSDIEIKATGIITWYDAPAAGNVISGTSALTNGTYFASQTIGICESPGRLAVSVTVSDPKIPTGLATQTFCALDNKKVSDITVAAAGTITWYDASAGGNVIAGTTALVTGKTYYASETIAGCESPGRLAVTVTISDPKIPAGAANQSFCMSDNKKVSDIAVTAAGTITWYDAPTGGNVIAGTTNLVTGKTYYASETISGCESQGRLAVAVTVTPQVIPVFAQLGPLLQNSPAPVLPATSTNGITGTWNPTTISTATSGTMTYVFTPDANQCAAQTTMKIDVQIDAVIIAQTLTGACENAKLDASKSIGDNLKYEWTLLDQGGVLSQSGGTITEFTLSPTYTGKLPAAFKVQLKITSGTGVTQSEIITINVDPLPVADVYSSGKLEKDGSMIVDGSVSTGASINYKWSTNEGKIVGPDNLATANLFGAGTYKLEISDVHGCQDSKSFKYPLVFHQIVANPDKVRISWEQDTTIAVMNNDRSTVALIPNSVTVIKPPTRGGTTVNKDGTITYKPNGKYAGTDYFDYSICDELDFCANTTVTIDIFADGVKIPEGFSPNGDGLNDKLVFAGLLENYPKSELYVFTRSGQLVYQSTNYLNDWGATTISSNLTNSQLVPTGTYYYVLKLGGTTRSIKGFVYIGY